VILTSRNVIQCLYQSTGSLDPNEWIRPWRASGYSFTFSHFFFVLCFHLLLLPPPIRSIRLYPSKRTESWDCWPENATALRQVIVAKGITSILCYTDKENHVLRTKVWVCTSVYMKRLGTFPFLASWHEFARTPVGEPLYGSIS
jgi:hypothetical protein